MSRANAVLILVELDPDKKILPISLECVNTGKKLAGAFGAKLLALIMGNSVLHAAEELRWYQIDAVFTVDHPLLETYHPETNGLAFRQVYEKLRPRVILMGDTLTSFDLAPRIAFLLNTGLITDCVGIECDSGVVRFIKPVYSSNIMAAYAFASEPYVVTMRSRVEEPAERREAPAVEITPLAVEIDASTIAIEIVQRVVEKDEGPRLTSADIIVSGGRGVGGPQGFGQLTELAEILHAAVGASRPPCDLGWIPPKVQIGQTGEKVGPAVYIAIGISGATQHVTGMSGSKTIVAINKDPKASIFKMADYGVVGNYEEVVPAFRERLSEILK
jgi:caffeyl-CoA reductase-Etf complex subunit CarE